MLGDSPWEAGTTAAGRRRRALQGVALGLGAPLGWLALRVLFHGASLPEELLAHAELYVYMTLGSCLAFSLFAVRLADSETELAEANADLATLAVTDELTRMKNARFFRARLEEAFADALRTTNPVCVVVIDLDHFKRVNDRYGHPVGDEVLREIARRIADGIRAGDTAARVGGEEFAIILPHTSTSDAERVARRIRDTVNSRPVAAAGTEIPITISAGVARIGPDHASPDALYSRADEALYEAKRRGRDRVVVS